MLYLVNIGDRPIFYLNSAVQGITDMDHAAQIAREVTGLNCSVVTVMEAIPQEDGSIAGGKCKTYYSVCSTH